MSQMKQMCFPQPLSRVRFKRTSCDTNALSAEEVTVTLREAVLLVLSRRRKQALRKVKGTLFEWLDAML